MKINRCKRKLYNTIYNIFVNHSWETLLFLSAMPHIFNFPEFSALLSSEDSFFLHRTKYFKSLFDL